MRKSSHSLLWLIAVIVLSAVALSKIERVQERREQLHSMPELKESVVMLIGYDGEDFPGLSHSGSYARIGCNDALIPTAIPVVSQRIESVLTALSSFTTPQGLYNPIKDKGLRFASLSVDERMGRVTVDFEGIPSFGGVCDTPRLRAQIEKTIALYAKEFTVTLNGSETTYRCMGDLRGDCK